MGRMTASMQAIEELTKSMASLGEGAEISSEIANNVLTQAAACTQALDIAAACGQSASETTKEDAKPLQQALDKLREEMRQNHFSFSEFGDLLEASWNDGDLNKPPSSKFEFQILPKLRSLTVEGGSVLFKVLL